MNQYYLFLEKEEKIASLNFSIYNHNYFKEKKNKQEIEKILLEKQGVIQKEIDKFNAKKSIFKKIVELEHEKLLNFLKDLKTLKDQENYYITKIEKDISEKFITHYQKEIDEIGLKQKTLYDEIKKITTEKDDLLKKLSVSKKNFDLKTADSQKEYKKLLSDQEVILKNLDEGFRKKFINLRNENIYPAVTSIKDASCPACSITFPSQIFQNVISSAYSFCPNCIRLLIIDKDYID